MVWTKHSCSSAEVSHGRGSWDVLPGLLSLGLQRTTGKLLLLWKSHTGAEGQANVTPDEIGLQVLGAMCWHRHVLERERSWGMCWPPAPFPYKSFTSHTPAFQACFRNQQCLCSPRAPFPRVLDVTHSGQKPLCCYATLLTFGCQNLELLWLLTTCNSSTEFSGTSYAQTNVKNWHRNFFILYRHHGQNPTVESLNCNKK